MPVDANPEPQKNAPVHYVPSAQQRTAIDNIFSYHAPLPGQPERYKKLRSKAADLAHAIAENAPCCPEQTLAIRKVQEAIMWANAAIAINEL